MTFGGWVHRRRWAILVTWVAATACVVVLTPSEAPSGDESATYLPDYTAYSRAIRAMGESFPDRGGLCEAVVVFERAGGSLAPADLRAVEDVAERIRHEAADQDGPLAGVHVRSPGSIPLAPNPLISAPSRGGQAALVSVGIGMNFITSRAELAVREVRRIVRRADLPDGLTASVTGSGGFGYDYVQATRRSQERSLWVTLAAVVVILLVVYRAPVASMIPLGAISVAVFIVMRLLNTGLLEAGIAQRTFVVVLIYGAGIDYSLLLISRYREFLDSGAPPPVAIAAAQDATAGAILASAGTDAAGLFMLTFADFSISGTTGPTVSMGLVVALVSVVTLVPALIGVIGPRMFWPGRQMGQVGSRRLWPAVARVVTARPGLVMVITLVALAVPAGWGAGQEWVYDTLAGVEEEFEDGVGNARAGLEAARRHWPVGQIAPTTVLLRSSEPLDEETWRDISARVGAAVLQVDGVRDVRSLSSLLGLARGKPLGSAPDTSPGSDVTGEPPAGGGWFGRTIASLLKRMGAGKLAPDDWFRRIARREYISADGRAMRLVVVQEHPALALEAMQTVHAVSAAARSRVRGEPALEVHVTGITAELLDVRDVTQRDFHRVALLALGVIFVLVLVLLRDVILVAFMVLATVLSYLATLGISYWVFVVLAGEPGLDWKVQVFLFVVMIAVGVDYNIFLASRLRQEARSLAPGEATRRAIVRTGPVISSCGVIMAATLGSLMSGELTLFVQLGFALSLGMLIDTFVVRPLMVPAFALLTGRTARFARRQVKWGR